MLDLVYVLVTIGFFGLMLLLTKACERLGRRTEVEGTTDER